MALMFNYSLIYGLIPDRLLFLISFFYKKKLKKHAFIKVLYFKLSAFNKLDKNITRFEETGPRFSFFQNSDDL